MATRDLRSYFSLKAKKEATRPKVNSRPDLVKLSEHVCLNRCRDCQQRIENCNFNPEKRKLFTEHFITHKS